MGVLSDSAREFVEYVRKAGQVTKKTQSFYRGLGYYMMVWNLRDLGILAEDGKNKNNEKIWRLTDKGVEVAEFLKKIRDLNDNMEELIK